MKRIILFSLFLSLFSIVCKAQSAKDIAHINSNALLEWMPQRTVAENELQDFADQLENELAILNSGYENKVADFQQRQEQLDEVTRKKLITEISDMEVEIREFTQEAQVKLEDKESELLEPIVSIAKQAIREVAAEQGFQYVLDSGVGVLLVQPESQDIMELVKEKILSYND